MRSSLNKQTRDSHPRKTTGKLSTEEICHVLGYYADRIHKLFVERREEELILRTHLKWAIGKFLYSLYPSLCFR
jgi:hypothetical protein